jgi:hypothetical protein
MERYFGYAKDTAGNVLTSATIRVKLAGTAVDATLYSDNAYTTLANPFTNNSDGSYQFYASNGRYDITITKAPYTFLATATADGSLYDPSSIITPAQITGDQNDYNPTNAANATFWRISSDAARTITGIVAGKSGQRIILSNIGSFTITLSNQSTSSGEANRIITGTGSDLSLTADAQRELWYDDTTDRWRVIGAEIPPMRVLDRDVSVISVTTSTAETDLYSYSIPGGTLTTNRAVRITLIGDSQNDSGGTRNFPHIRAYYGTTSTTPFFAFTGAINMATSTSNYPWQLSGTVSAFNTTNAQVASGRFVFSTGIALGTAVVDTNSYSAVHNSLAIDSTANQIIKVTTANNVATTGIATRLLAAQLELL